MFKFARLCISALLKFIFGKLSTILMRIATKLWKLSMKFDKMFNKAYDDISDAYQLNEQKDEES